MGTSGAYEGSGGAWRKVREEATEWLDGVSTNDEGVAPLGGTEPAQQTDPSTLAPLLQSISSALGWTSAGLSLGRNRGSGGGGSAGSGGGGRRFSSSPGGNGRSRQRAASVGGRLTVGLDAFRRGDEQALSELGLDLAELAGLTDPYLQAKRIREAATSDASSTLEEDELRVASSRTALWALDDNPGATVEDIIRYFVAEYVFEIALTEIGSTMRDGERDGTKAIGYEARIHDAIGALANRVPIERDARGIADVTRVVDGVLSGMRTVMGVAR